MNGGSNGSNNRLLYDSCSYEKRLYESTSPLAYRLYTGAVENCNKCYDANSGYYFRYDLVDVETELRNQTRPLSHCDQFKYSPNCARSGLCLSTFDASVPVTPAPEVCPIVYNNIPKQTHPGYHLPDPAGFLKGCNGRRQ